MKKPVLVVGGGIAGIQASHDLAEMGIPVFLVESSPSIGGRMAQLDKTFPTNDCSACILAPKVTSCYNHPLVKTLSFSDLLEVKGEAPDLTAVIKRKPRYIDEDSCKGCNDCFDTCPVVVKSEFDMEMGDRKAIYKPFAQAVPNKAIIDKKGSSPCKFECPAHMDAHAYITLAGQEKYDEALRVIRRTTPFAGVLGRVCLHPCETNCTRQYVEEPLAIAGIKRFVADTLRKKRGKIGIGEEIEDGLNEAKAGNDPKAAKACKETKDTKVAIVGSGPAGLNCAYKLALEGYQVTVFEALPVAGGMLKVGIPDYRLDKQVLAEEIELVQDLGVEIKLNTEVGKDLTLEDLKRQGYKAVFLAIGAHRDMKLGIPGEDADGVLSSVDFLREVNLGSRQAPGRKVLVIGGGNVAMDAARTAVRLGCEVTVVYRRTLGEMPANEWEVEHAMEEGVRFEFLAAPEEIKTEGGRVAGLSCVKNRLGKPDASGRRRPEAIPDSEFILEADCVIKSIGQFADNIALEAAGFDVFDDKGRLVCDRATTAVPAAGVFCGGDALRGPATMIEAVADGNRAAKAIINYIENMDLPIEPFLLPQTPLEEIDTRSLAKEGRAAMPMLSLAKRKKTFDEAELGFKGEQGIKEALRCVDCSICCECRLCEETCQADSICHDQKAEVVEIPVSSVIFSSGYDPSDEIPPEFGYDRYRDVVTSLEFERILSAGGPYSGHVQRPSDNRPPKRIAFIQCVGSRDKQCGADYCSSVCCMYAIKEAMITKEHLPSVEDIDIYFMDMRAYGKDFDKYIDSAKSKYNIGFVRSRISGVEQGDDGMLLVQHVGEDGAATEAPYDIVVLSVGMKPQPENVKLYNRSGVKTDRFGFIWSNEFDPTVTSKEGIYACGVAAGPKDIPETVIEASAAAAGAAKTAKNSEVELYKDYHKFFNEKTMPPLRDVSKEPVKIGVFICHCGVNIGGYLDIDDIVAYSKTLPFVAYAEQNLYTCSVDAQKTITDTIAELGLNRIVVASCTPRTHEPLFQDVLMQAGLNPYLFAMANIRDQCSWVHMDVPDAATFKAKELVRMAVGKVTNAKQLARKKIDVTKSALVIGGGVSGMAAALEIAGMGYKAHLIDRDSRLGGNALKLAFTVAGRPVGPYIEDMISRVNGHPLIDVYLNTTVDELSGYVGNYQTTLKCGEFPREITHGVVVVAVGAHEQKPAEYLYGQNKRVTTMLEFEQSARNNFSDLKGVKNIVMIQCVGSREGDHPYCSRVCCNQAVKNALLLKERDKNINITILYREMRTYGLNELAYTEARRAGIAFARYDVEAKPVVSEEGGRLSVRVYEPVLREEIAIPADRVVLSSAIVPDAANNGGIAQMLKVPLNQEGFFLEAHVKLRPVDFATEGVYMCGLAHSPKNMRESVIQGKAAAGRAATVISKAQLETEGTIAAVNADLCSACGDCELVCAYKAVEVTDVPVRGGTVRRAVVNDVLCKGCGTCAAACRCGAIDVGGFSDKQVLAEIKYMLRKATG